MITTLPFSGFTPETIQFLTDLKENNFRQWFEDHRELYEIELAVVGFAAGLDGQQVTVEQAGIAR